MIANLLFWPWMAAAIYAGFSGYPFLVSVTILAIVSMLIFFFVRPGTLTTGWNTNGVFYLLTMLLRNLFFATVLFFIGYVIAGFMAS